MEMEHAEVNGILVDDNGLSMLAITSSRRTNIFHKFISGAGRVACEWLLVEGLKGDRPRLKKGLEIRTSCSFHGLILCM